MSIFEGEIDLLHAQAESTGISLKFFYEAALEEIEETYTRAPEKEIALEMYEGDPGKFKAELLKQSLIHK